MSVDIFQICYVIFIILDIIVRFKFECHGGQIYLCHRMIVPRRVFGTALEFPDNIEKI